MSFMSPSPEQVRPAPLRAVVVGAGTGGTLSIDAVTRSDRFELVGVADVSTAALGRFTDIATSTDYASLFADLAPDIVCVSTYPPSHADVARCAIEAGARGLLVEKPLGDTTAAGRDILAATRQAPVPFVVPHGLMAQAAPLDIIRRIRAGDIGRLVLVEMESAQWDMINAGIHWVQFFSALTEPDSVATVLTAADASSRTFRDGMQVENDSITIATTASGVRLMLQTGDYITVARPDTLCVMRMIGTDGMIEYGAWNDHFTLIESGRDKREITPAPLPVTGHQFHLEHLADLIESGSVDEVIPLTSLQALEVVEAAYLSNRTSSQITLPLADALSPSRFRRENSEQRGQSEHREQATNQSNQLDQSGQPQQPQQSGQGEQAEKWDPGRPYSGVGGGRNGREL
jgi:predicted dehydrogenase